MKPKTRKISYDQPVPVPYQKKGGGKHSRVQNQVCKGRPDTYIPHKKTTSLKESCPPSQPKTKNNETTFVPSKKKKRKYQKERHKP